MRRRWLRGWAGGWLLLLALSVLSMTGPGGAAAGTSDYGVYVQDDAGVLSSSAKDKLYAQARWLHDQTKSAQVAVVTVKADKLKNTTLEQYAVERFRAMKLGSKTRNDGVMLLYVQGGKPHVRIEVGYGLEGRITDGKAGAILDKYFLPNEEKGSLKKAFEKTQTALIREVAAEYGIDLSSLQDVDDDFDDDFFNDDDDNSGMLQQFHFADLWAGIPLLVKIVAVIAVIALIVLDFVFTGGAITWGILSMLGRGGGRGGGGGGRGGGGSSGGGGASR